MDITDICVFKSEKDIIDCLKQRFKTNNIYTFVAKVIIAINPFKRISGLYTEDKNFLYKKDLNDELPPHLYAIDQLELRLSTGFSSILISIARKQPNICGDLKLDYATNYVYLSDCRGQNNSNGSIKLLTVDRALASFGISREKRTQIYQILGAILHLGNVVITQLESEKCTISESSIPHLEQSAHLLNTDQRLLKGALLTRVIELNGSDPIIMDLSLSKANKAKNSLVKILYEHVFQEVMFLVNKTLSSDTQSYTKMQINMLDIAGFESFEKNYFEQMCINYVNERVQQMFVKLMIKDEEEWYAKECLELPKIPFLDNSIILDVFDHKYNGIFKILDDTMKIQCQSSEVLLQNILLNHPQLLKQKGCQRNEFIVQHFAGDVVYNVSNFLEKNEDIVPKAIKDICSGIYYRNQDVNSDRNIPQMNSHTKSSTLVLKMGTNELINKLIKTECSFIRCIKPNTKQLNDTFDEDYVLSQLVSSCCNCTITIPCTYQENISTEERLRILLRQEREMNKQLNDDYRKLQKRQLELIATISSERLEKERIIEENKKLKEALETTRVNISSDHNYF
ncbi:unconventional myosin-VI-like [Contarinia nasturtii]|uniref:unconventional myosin-VI-like n=1 Tax=Contarinia nasturtii TaxID=265458 RepID=UPI0012D46CA2|nr:unconventional myosin-VI-like [Contarinia nasturtii]